MPGGGRKPGVKFGGRARGTPNKVTTEARETFRLVYEARLADLDRWIRETGDGFEKTVVDDDGEERKVTVGKDPGKAAALLASMAEHFVPKLQRHEVTGSEGKAIVFRIEEPAREPT